MSDQPSTGVLTLVFLITMLALAIGIGMGGWVR